MKTSFFKFFLSKRSEEKWLNSMGENGYLLTAISDSTYSFEFSEGDKFYYSIQYLDTSTKSDEALQYYKTLSKEGISPLLSSGNWVYFVKHDLPITPSSEVYKKNSIPYFWRALYLLFFAFCGAVVCGYQVFAINYLSRIGNDGKGLIEKTYEISKKGGFFDKLLNVIKFIGNTFYKMLNGYFGIWTRIFGESDAVAVISVVAPITIALLVFGALNFERCFTYRTLSKNSNTDEITPMAETGGTIDAEQNI